MPDVTDFLQGVIRSATGGLGGFIGGIAVQVIANAAGISSVAGVVPVTYILPVFTIGGIALGFADGLMPNNEE